MVFCFRPTRLKETGTQFALRLSLLPSRPITALLPPQCAVKTVLTWKSSKSVKKMMRLSQQKQPQKLLKKKTHDVKWEKDSVMWNRVRVKYDSVWPAPTPNIRCLFFVHHIILPYYDYYYYYYPTLSPTITTTNAPRHLPVPLIYSSSPSYMTRHPPLPQLQHRNPISYSSSSPSTTSPTTVPVPNTTFSTTFLLPYYDY